MNNCINCKWFSSGICNCKDFSDSIQLIDNTENKVIKFIEDGYLSESIHEEINLKYLGSLFSSELIENGYIKKPCIDKVDNLDYYNSEVEIMEYIDTLVSNLLIRYFKNNNHSKVTIKDPYNFICCHWE